MTLLLGSDPVTAVYVGGALANKVYLGDTLLWPLAEPETFTFSTVGTHTFTIPANCTFLDVVLLGSGAGGHHGGGGFVAGLGGGGGKWAGVTLQRGVHIPVETTTITLVVPDGGPGGPGGALSGGGTPGSPCTASASGWSGLSADGGVFTEHTGQDGQPAGNFTHAGELYVGGAAVTSGNGTPGNPPGGGGRGGDGGLFTGSAGGKGAPGRAWIRTY
ncbi:glycine-rich domain-containing protein [Mycolicibacterium hassiacum]|uniref:glycine-rich domain-containing protein n=1 Tax=Mycolicibacterium hassiacum TaxID=46351 RepID=UPI000368C3DB|nr:hypothetical protein [Mycolicibacterium hassiacum]MDA4085994.1 hypothetical protein [Mycolicibacterium hassiacum DSM 44199]